MTYFKNIAYIVLMLALLLNSLPVANSQEINPVTYRAEFIPFGKGLNLKKTFPSEDGALGLQFELVVSPGTITAEVGGEILFYEGNETIQVRSTGGRLSSDGGVILTGDIVIDVLIPLPEAFFEEDDALLIQDKVPIPGLRRIEKGWNESKSFNSFLLKGSSPESVKLNIGIRELVTIRLSAVEIVPIVASVILSGGTLTAAVKIFADKISNYLDAGIALHGGLGSELTLSGKSVIVNGTPIAHERRPLRAPNFDPTEEAYQIESNYDEEFTYTLDFIASSDTYVKVVFLGGIEIWSDKNQIAQKRIPILPKDTFDLNFGGVSTLEQIDVLREPLDSSDLHTSTGGELISSRLLEDRIKKTLSIPPDKLITRNDMRRLTKLDASFLGTSLEIKLEGLEHAVNLEHLNLRSNLISDVSALSGLKNLTYLDLNGTSISNVLPLSELTNLTHLHLRGNTVSNMSFLSKLTNLTHLHLQENIISEVALSDLPNLMHLDLYNNAISKVSLSNLPNLTYLNLASNPISEVSLSNFPDWTQLLSGLNFERNAILKLSVSDLPNLTRYGLNNTPLTEISLSNLPNLTNLSFADNALTEISLSNLPNLTNLDFRNNALSEVSLSDLPSLTTLFLGHDSLSKASLSNLPSLTHLYIREASLSELSLSKLPNLVHLELQENVFSDISALSELSNLTTLKLWDNAISDVSPLSDITNLTRLELSINSISDISPLSGLTNLTYLSLDNNSISDVSALSGLTNLTEIILWNNTISELSLSNLTNLTRLYLTDNTLSKVSLSNLPNLEDLSLYRNPLSIVFLSGLPSVKELSLHNNGISEVFLSGLTNLTHLSLSDNPLSKVSLSNLPNLEDLSLYRVSISDISDLSSFKNLKKLDLWGNSISDVSDLSGLTNLVELNLSNNAISDVSSLTGLPNLKEFHLFGNLLNYTSRSIHIPAMQARGVWVYFGNRTTPILVKVSGEDQIGAPSLALPTPLVVQALDVEDKPIADVPIRFAVYEGKGTLSTTNITTDATGKAQTVLTLGPDAGENKVGAIADELEMGVSFTATATLDAVTPLQIAEDVNGDGVVNIQDLVLVSSNLGEIGENKADVNGDGIVNVQDIVKIAAKLQ